MGSGGYKMGALFEQQIKRIQNHDWHLNYDKETHTAWMVNENGESMDVQTFGVCLDALKNQAHEMKEVKTQQSKAGPLDKADRERLGIRDYKLIVDEQSEYAREVFEVYSDRYDIYTLDYFYVVNNRKEYDIGFQAHLNKYDSDKVLESLQAFVKRSKSWNFWVY